MHRLTGESLLPRNRYFLNGNAMAQIPNFFPANACSMELGIRHEASNLESE